jgi:hypothetical protein
VQSVSGFSDTKALNRKEGEIYKINGNFETNKTLPAATST